MSIGAIVAVVVLLLAILFAAIGQMDLKTAGLFVGVCVAILLGGYMLPVRTP